MQKTICVYCAGQVSSASVSNEPAMSPATALPSAVQRNDMPIIWPTKRRGASVVIALKPTGESASSPIVWNRYVNTSQVGKTC